MSQRTYTVPYDNANDIAKVYIMKQWSIQCKLQSVLCPVYIVGVRFQCSKCRYAIICIMNCNVWKIFSISFWVIATFCCSSVVFRTVACIVSLWEHATIRNLCICISRSLPNGQFCHLVSVLNLTMNQICGIQRRKSKSNFNFFFSLFSVTDRTISWKYHSVNMTSYSR